MAAAVELSQLPLREAKAFFDPATLADPNEQAAAPICLAILERSWRNRVVELKSAQRAALQAVAPAAAAIEQVAAAQQPGVAAQAAQIVAAAAGRVEAKRGVSPPRRAGRRGRPEAEEEEEEAEAPAPEEEAEAGAGAESEEEREAEQQLARPPPLQLPEGAFAPMQLLPPQEMEVELPAAQAPISAAAQGLAQMAIIQSELPTLLDLMAKQGVDRNAASKALMWLTNATELKTAFEQASPQQRASLEMELERLRNSAPFLQFLAGGRSAEQLAQSILEERLQRARPSMRARLDKVAYDSALFTLTVVLNNPEYLELAKDTLFEAKQQPDGRVLYVPTDAARTVRPAWLGFASASVGQQLNNIVDALGVKSAEQPPATEWERQLEAFENSKLDYPAVAQALENDYNTGLQGADMDMKHAEERLSRLRRTARARWAAAASPLAAAAAPPPMLVATAAEQARLEKLPQAKVAAAENAEAVREFRRQRTEAARMAKAKKAEEVAARRARAAANLAARRRVSEEAQAESEASS